MKNEIAWRIHPSKQYKVLIKEALPCPPVEHFLCNLKRSLFVCDWRFHGSVCDELWSRSPSSCLLSWESRTVAVTSWYNFGERCLRYVVRRNGVTGLQRCNHITKSFILYCAQTAQIETSTDCAGFVARVSCLRLAFDATLLWYS